MNFSNATQQYTKFIENTIRPLERWLKTVFDTLILEDFGETKVEFMINDTHIDDIEQKSRIAQSNVSQGVWTPNEARQYIGYDIYQDPLADSLFVPSGRMPLEHESISGNFLPRQRWVRFFHSWVIRWGVCDG